MISTLVNGLMLYSAKLANERALKWVLFWTFFGLVNYESGYASNVLLALSRRRLFY